MTTYRVRLTDEAEADLEGIAEYVEQADSAASAGYLVASIRQRADSLTEFPERGPYVNELLAQGIRTYRQVLFGPYRIIYEVTDEEVVVHLIADGRREMGRLLESRLL